ncbi:hypothetical protein SBA4_6980008 [Candidatus Sulfopaludibacter sp. SbA4]|nr:hypothetical protein SBA4_6980008 [Candidatus Sulfopaludibacter sp. SbA4]
MAKDIITKLTEEADAFDARIKQVPEMEEKGFWLCENGHEVEVGEHDAENIANGTQNGQKRCAGCDSITKLIKRSEMSSQEKYESDKERKEAEKMAAAKREEIAQHEENLKNQEATAKHFRVQSASSRKLAEALRNL